MDDEVGFKRSEMNSEELAGTVKGFDRHVFLTWGAAEEWPGDPFEEQYKDTLPGKLQAALQAAKKEIKSKVKLTLVGKEDHLPDKDGSVLIFPDYLRCDIGPAGTGIPELIKYLKGELSKADLRSASPGSSVQDIEDSVVFICAHAKRDERCGYCGPQLGEAVEKLKKCGDVGPVKVRKCSHVGGHKYAGNLIVYSGKDTKDDGHWYGYVTPENVRNVLLGREVRGSLWRGRIGISEASAKQERKQASSATALKNYALISLVLVAAVGIASYSYIRSKKK